MADGSSSNNSIMMNDNSSSSNKNTFILGWNSEFECNTINGIQAPRSVNWWSDSSNPVKEQAQQGSVSRRKSRRDLKSTIEEVINLTFRLFKRLDEDGGYILAMREDVKLHDYFYVLHPVEGKRTLTANECRLNEIPVKEVTEDVEPPSSNKYNLSLIQRINGKWHAEIRKRNPDSAKTDKLYYHEKVKNTIRSLPDVAAFILYGEIPEIARREKRKLDQVIASSNEMNKSMISIPSV